jgi:hypothetical protein
MEVTDRKDEEIVLGAATTCGGVVVRLDEGDEGDYGRVVVLYKSRSGECEYEEAFRVSATGPDTAPVCYDVEIDTSILPTEN